MNQVPNSHGVRRFTELPHERGGVPVIYLDLENEILCARCANKIMRDIYHPRKPREWFLHWEGRALKCVECGEIQVPG
jgi:hypothetical protein